MDLIDEIAKELKFKYKFVLAPDGQYGSYNKLTKQWNGLIRELRERVSKFRQTVFFVQILRGGWREGGE